MKVYSTPNELERKIKCICDFNPYNFKHDSIVYIRKATIDRICYEHINGIKDHELVTDVLSYSNIINSLYSILMGEKTIKWYAIKCSPYRFGDYTIEISFRLGIGIKYKNKKHKWYKTYKDIPNDLRNTLIKNIFRPKEYILYFMESLEQHNKLKYGMED